MLILNSKARHRDLIACAAGTAARAAARDRDEQARRDEAVLDALEPLAGLRR
ncbi:hypothetical protein ACGFX2_15960 [Streptomyces goshikiensis]|uniref:hypothetical protein n=1 Tax=Streptomyces goshikiensis TaxID=1942 RepID=UPI003716A7F6